MIIQINIKMDILIQHFFRIILNVNNKIFVQKY